MLIFSFTWTAPLIERIFWEFNWLPFLSVFQRDAEIMQQKQKKADEAGKAGPSKSK